MFLFPFEHALSKSLHVITKFLLKTSGYAESRKYTVINSTRNGCNSVFYYTSAQVAFWHQTRHINFSNILNPFVFFFHYSISFISPNSKRNIMRQQKFRSHSKTAFASESFRDKFHNTSVSSM